MQYFSLFNKISTLLLPITCCLLPANAQENKVVVTGSIQSNMMVAPEQDEKIGTEAYDNNSFLTNTYADIMLQSKYVDAGARMELTQWPMPGFNDQYNEFKGWGLPNIWVKGKFKNIDITLGQFYEQFGSGMLLRLYEERTLGIDNSLLGARITYTPVNGVTIKALSGVQRNYWGNGKHILPVGKSLVSGADAEIGLEEFLPTLKHSHSHLAIGASWVNKEENTDEIINADALGTYRVNVPKFVNAWGERIRYQHKGLSILAECAQKGDDPNALNNYIFGLGHAEMLSLTYTKKGFSALAQVKRSENMAFRSNRSESSLSKACYVNHMPAFTVDQTYALAALYPYATQNEGEWAYQFSAAYKFKGRYAPKFKINYSLVRGLQNARSNLTDISVRGTEGYKSAYFSNGDVYYQDLDFIYEKKSSANCEHHVMIMYQQYNKTIIQGHGGNIYSTILVYEPKVKLSKKVTLRCEAQYLYTEHESGDWMFGLAELSIAPYLMFTVSDQYGRCEPQGSTSEYGDKTHYYNVSVTGNYKSHRLQVGYGRTRAGYNCNGGVCRYIPASKGVTLSYNYNF